MPALTTLTDETKILGYRVHVSRIFCQEVVCCNGGASR